MSDGPPVVESIADVREAVRAARAAGKRIGLVPTMGALHEGHVELIAACRREAGLVVVSIFVNPTQFGPAEDFTRYPRTPEADRLRCADGRRFYVGASHGRGSFGINSGSIASGLQLSFYASTHPVTAPSPGLYDGGVIFLNYRMEAVRQ